jgi:predicted nucleic acid-binding protein
MDYLVDTDVIINYFHNQKDASFLFEKIKNKPINISVVTLIEIEYGITKSSNPEKRRKEFQAFVDYFSIKTIPIDSKIGIEFIKIKTELEKKKTPLADFDLLIAATAKTNNLMLVTKKQKHFKRVKDLMIFE